ncbi:MAG: glycosyltransferase family 4 protein [Candidatus Omnitrophica bacterium]|nr:glycosyltransferase family 4 protein [Candidatus Omnitrophota bacterium]
MKIKLLFIDDPLEPVGGGQRSLLALLEGLNRQRFEPSVILSREGEFARILRESRIPISIIKLKDLFQEIGRRKPDLIHCNAATNKYAFIAALGAKFFNIPFVWHVRVIDSAGWRDHIMASLSTKIIVISEAVRGKIRGPQNQKKMIKIYNCVTGEFHHDDDRKKMRREFGWEDNVWVVGVFSRLDPWKGHSLFLEVANLLVKSLPDSRFLIVGDGPPEYKQALEKLVNQHHLESKTVFTGFRRDIPRLMNMCDVVVNLSVTPEPFGRTIIEAMSCQIPVVATNMGGPTEIISNGEDGFLTPPSPEELAAAVEKLRRDPVLYQKIVRNAYQKVLNYFTLDRHIAAVENIYSQILN